MLEASIRLALTANFPVLSILGEMEALVGFKPEEFLAARVSFKNLIHPQDLDIAEELFACENHQQAGSFNIRLRQANSRIRCLKGHYTKQIAPDGVVILECFLQDAKSLRQIVPGSSEMDNFKAMMDNTDDYIYFKDRNHVFTGASKTLVDNTDPLEPSHDLLGLTDYDIFPEEYADIYYQLEKQVFTSGLTAHEVQQYQAKDGRKGWVDNRKYPVRDENGVIVGLFGIARDITERKRSEESLQESEQKLRSLFKLSPLGIAMTDMEGRFIEFNESFMQICGYSQQELRALDYWELTPQKYAYAEAQQLSMLAASGKYGPYEKEYQRKDGSLIPICLNGVLIKGKDGRDYIWSIIEDISKRRQAEQELLENKAELHRLLEIQTAILNALPFNIALIDPRGLIQATNWHWDSFALDNNLSSAKIGRYSYDLDFCNSNALADTEISPCLEAGIYHVLSGDKFHFTHSAAHKGLLAVLRGEQKAFSLEYSNYAAEQQRWFRLQVTPLDGLDGVVVSHENITERKQLENEIKASVSKFRSIIEVSPIPMVLCDDRFNTSFLNPAFTTSFGYCLADVPTLTDWWLLACRDPEYRRSIEMAWQTNLEKARRQQTQFPPLEINIRCKNQDLKTVLATNATLQHDFSGDHLVILYDITRLKQQEEQNKAHLAELAHVTRLGLMGQMASGLAHEINQPLTAIASYTQASINMFSLEKPNLELLADIANKTKLQSLRAGQIVHRMRDFIKFKANANAAIDINTLIQDAVGLCQAEIKQNNISLDLNLENNLPLVCVDPIQIEQVLINLIRNSIDALLNLPEEQFRSLSIHNQLTSENKIQVRVKDNGPGITKEQQQKIFMPFYTTKTSGLGMGLSICRSLIEAHGGVLRFNSEVGKGTTFYFSVQSGMKAGGA